MAKKCIPGVICIENITLLVFAFLFLVLAYMYYVFIVKVVEVRQYIPQIPLNREIPIRGVSTRLDPYGPPLRTDDMYFPSDSGDIRGLPPVIPVSFARPVGAVPVNIETRGLNQDYTQLGILTRTVGGDLILPLLGRRLMTGLDKWQYYTISNSGNMNTKLPIKVRGKSCSGEYGCDFLMEGDTVYVEGYNDTFRATIYENGKFSYIPLI
jgi:hypothetical protein